MSMPTDFGPDSGGRIKGLTIVKAIVYGNIARYFGKKREEDGHTHQWTVYVKPYANEDMSGYVKKVHFKLHESYANPNRIITKPPFELTETGWGEFEIVIKIYFQDPNERPVTLYHILKLFQSPITEGTPQVGRALVIEEKKEKTLEAIKAAQIKVRTEISELKEKLSLAKDTINKFKEEITKLQNNQSSSLITAI
ncbi:unnamed protein product [Leptidea sinapis]|uniref:YEATS domain-containing protein n=1 Tax=Leptidea sinapis TaxID=189913 RepID=A0A5E4QYC1_9NEOP|nr:unnamed protein product [Leptidea sinapis]